MGVGDGAGACAVLRRPLMGAGGAFSEFPFVAEEVLEEIVAPLCGGGGPGDFQAAGDGIAGFAGFEAALPAQALVLDACGFGLMLDKRRVAGTVGFAEAVATGDERDGLFIVHGHAGEGFADVVRRGDRIGVTVGALGVDVNQAHLDGGEGVFEFASGEAAIVGVIWTAPRRPPSRRLQRLARSGDRLRARLFRGPNRHRDRAPRCLRVRRQNRRS